LAARSQYESPDVQLVRLGVDARRRGIAFDDFWTHCVREGKANILTSTDEAVAQERIATAWAQLDLDGEPLDCVRWPSDSGDRLTWQPAIYSAAEGWRRSYERVEETSRDLALRHLGEVFAQLREHGEPVEEDEPEPTSGLALEAAVA
jgi:hypothetical protein